MHQSKKCCIARQDDADYSAARAYFPRGLTQPENGYRFSADALLLGCFLEPAPKMRLLDLGSGVGAVALTMLCRCPSLRAVGVDVQSEYVAAAKDNAARLGFSRAFTSLCADIHAPDLPIAPASFDLVLANPPYRQRERGRLPSNPARLLALFEQPDTLSAFCRCAARALKPEGRFGITFPADRREELLAQLYATGLSPVRVLYIQSHNDSSPRVALVEAIKTQQTGTCQSAIDERSLTLHTTQQYDGVSHKVTLFSTEALAFCPFLARQ
jgi:tRNA1Val (adenine37-N6)-methyltransferase